MVTVYTKNNCSSCFATTRLLTRYNIPYHIVNLDELLETDPQHAYITSLGYLQAPVVVVSEDQHWSGMCYDNVKQLAETLEHPTSRTEVVNPPRLPETVDTVWLKEIV